MLAAISLPPLTDDANRHTPTASHPGKRGGRAERCLDPGQREPGRLSRRADRIPAQLHRQRRKRRPKLTRASTEPPDPAPGRGMRDPGPLRRRPDPTPPARHLRDHRTDRLGHIQPPGQHERRQQHMAHPAPRTPQPRHEDLPAAARRPHITPVTRPEHQRPRARRAPRARELHPPASGNVGIDRQRARPYHGHGDTASDPSPRRGQTTAGRDPSRSTRTAKSWPPHTGPGSNIAKEHDRRPGQDAQIVRPLTTPYQHFVGEPAPVIAAHPELDARCSG